VASVCGLAGRLGEVKRLELAGCQGRNSQLAGHRSVRTDGHQPPRSNRLGFEAIRLLSEICIQLSDRTRAAHEEAHLMV
jgi:hypothetical protein